MAVSIDEVYSLIMNFETVEELQSELTPMEENTYAVLLSSFRGAIQNILNDNNMQVNFTLAGNWQAPDAVLNFLQNAPLQATQRQINNWANYNPVRKIVMWMEAQNGLPNGSTTFNNNSSFYDNRLAVQEYIPVGRLGSNYITDNTRIYNVNNLDTYFATIFDIGRNGDTNQVPYVINIANTYTFISEQSHYAYPMIIGDTMLNNFWPNYIETYTELFQNITFNSNDVSSFLKNEPWQGVQTTIYDLRVLSALIANYFCECDRNLLQLFIAMRLLAKGVTSCEVYTEQGYYIDNYYYPTYQWQWPVFSGDWTKKWSWGTSLENPHILENRVSQGEFNPQNPTDDLLTYDYHRATNNAGAQIELGVTTKEKIAKTKRKILRAIFVDLLLWLEGGYPETDIKLLLEKNSSDDLVWLPPYLIDFFTQSFEEARQAIKT